MELATHPAELLKAARCLSLCTYRCRVWGWWATRFWKPSACIWDQESTKQHRAGRPGMGVVAEADIGCTRVCLSSPTSPLVLIQCFCPTQKNIHDSPKPRFWNWCCEDHDSPALTQSQLFQELNFLSYHQLVHMQFILIQNQSNNHDQNCVQLSQWALSRNS